MKVILGGAMGRMGRAVVEAIMDTPHGIACGVDVAYQGESMPFPMVSSFEDVQTEADVLIDFSSPKGLEDMLCFLEKTKMPAVLCATGYSEAGIEKINGVSQKVAVLRSANMSLGVHVLRALVEQATKVLGDTYDVEIVEKHHRMKLDSPSGTALLLMEAVQEGRDYTPVFGRHGKSTQRKPTEIGVHAVRGGSVTGDHEVGFYGNGEQILLTHRAENRSLFAQGALQAGAFLVGKEAGLYSMADVVKERLHLA